MTLHRNWPAICKLRDPLLRLLISTTDDPRLLASLQLGFPSLFMEQKSELRIPASAIRAKKREIVMREEEECTPHDADIAALYDWEEAIDFFNIPTALRTHDHRVPWEVDMQLMGGVLVAGIRVMYLGQECILTDVYMERGGFPDGRPYTGQNPILNVTLVLAKFIDLNA